MLEVHAQEQLWIRLRRFSHIIRLTFADFCSHTKPRGDRRSRRILKYQKTSGMGQFHFFLELSVAQPDVCKGGHAIWRAPYFLKGPSPQFQFSLRISATFILQIWKKRFFVKSCKKNVKFRPYGAPDMRWGGHVSPVPPPPGCATVNHLTFIGKKRCDSVKVALYLESGLITVIISNEHLTQLHPLY